MCEFCKIYQEKCKAIFYCFDEICTNTIVANWQIPGLVANTKSVWGKTHWGMEILSHNAGLTNLKKRNNEHITHLSAVSRLLLEF